VDSTPIRVRTIIHAWWPLAASWLLMGLELPLVSAALARLPRPLESLAAYGGVVLPVSMVIEGPIIMLLAASTALSKNWQHYRLMRGFVFVVAGSLTALHALVAFTPLYYWVVGRLLGVPESLLEPARIGLRIMTPWTFAIAYRRFQQGVLIRFGHSRAVGVGTAIRLVANALVLILGYVYGSLSGIVVGTLAVVAGVVCESVYAGLRSRPVLERSVRPAVMEGAPLTAVAFVRFYLPLAITPLVVFFAMPLSSAAMSRMPRAIDSLAAWPVLAGLVLVLRSGGFALNEVVVSQLGRPGAVPALRRFTLALGVLTSALLLGFAATPLGDFWFARISALPVQLLGLAHAALWICVLLPAVTSLQSYYQGAIVHSHRTRGIIEAVFLYLAVSGCILLAGIHWARISGLYVAWLSTLGGSLVQLGWLRTRARDALRKQASTNGVGEPIATRAAS
jgi:hypothetical protein